MRNMKNKFIITQDANVANRLKTAGFRLLRSSDTQWIFQNTNPVGFKFEEFDRSKVAYTNILPI